MILTFIPDIHGRIIALERLLEGSGLVRGDEWVGGPEHRLVQLGDLIDRGPRSMECVERMLALNLAYPDRVLCVLGNHEDLLLSALKGDRNAAQDWRLNGGNATESSYGREVKALLGVDGRHRKWLESLPVSLDLDGVLVCHAGLAKHDADATDRRSLVHGRPPHHQGDWKAVVCGHTPTLSGNVEFRGGVYYTDVGLGMVSDVELQLLRLDTTTLKSEIILCGAI